MGVDPFQLMTAEISCAAFSVLAVDVTDGLCVKEEQFPLEVKENYVNG